MALSSSPNRDLVLPLVAGLHDRDACDGFLSRLIERTRAARACLLVRADAGEALSPIRIERFAADAVPRPPLDITALEGCGLLPLTAMRASRVYALEEMLAYGDAPVERRQAMVRGRERFLHARFVRIVASASVNAWLIVVDERTDFQAGDSAILSALVPFVAAAVTRLVEETERAVRLAMAEEALALMAVGQVALDGEGRVIALDTEAARRLDAQSGQRLPLPPQAGEIVESLCAQGIDAAGIHAIPRGEGPALLLRPPGKAVRSQPASARMIAMVRGAPKRRADSVAAIARLHGLSLREAALAEALSRGVPLIEAGAALHLTRETTRNYSKRIYAKTGASGQADLVRLILTGLSPFA